ncbi:hypothetical protein LZ012_00245 [Dechloromonas sp. XY25]|uniref:Uncharacterized protein n=1 Tax=Dechloromonas hankyongensis TaxID=2908002 RepID=A0ABS9JWY6_9RHOO|nr:hypothetical protein [Dechloromonas hankyongensis]MCG2575417.1 hypothetical protein [Dechloromonas hankyongensis]
MFDKFSLAAGVLALMVFTYAQQQGWDLFDDVANSRHGSGSGSSRSYHK